MKKLSISILERFWSIAGSLLVSLSIVLSTSACGITPMAKTTPVVMAIPPTSAVHIFFTAYRENKSIELWKSTLENDSQLPVYAEPTDYPFSALPRDEQVFLYGCKDAGTCGGKPTDNDLRLSWGGLYLSPDKDMIAWREDVDFCPPQLGYCDGGTSRIILWKINESEPKVIVEFPHHLSLLSHQSIYAINWLPGNQEISYILESQDAGWSKLQTINIESLLVQDIVSNVSSYRWSPDGNEVAYTNYSGSKQNFSVVNKENQTLFQLSNNITDNNIIDYEWSPDGKRIVLTAISSGRTIDVTMLEIPKKKSFSVIQETSSDPTNYITSWSPQGTKLAILQSPRNEKPSPVSLMVLDTSHAPKIQSTTDLPLQMETIPLEAVPQAVRLEWSPDGDAVGVSVRSNKDINNNQIVFVDGSTGKVISQFNHKMLVSNWRYSTNGTDVFLFLKDQEKSCPKTMFDTFGIYDWRHNSYEEVALNTILGDDLKNCKLSIGDVSFSEQLLIPTSTP